MSIVILRGGRSGEVRPMPHIMAHASHTSVAHTSTHPTHTPPRPHHSLPLILDGPPAIICSPVGGDLLLEKEGEGAGGIKEYACGGGAAEGRCGEVALEGRCVVVIPAPPLDGHDSTAPL